MPAQSSPRSRRIRRARPPRSRRALGALVLGASLAGIVLAVSQPDPFGGGVTVSAVFADTSGIGAVGDDVRVAGVPVGHITGRARQGDDALVTMELDPGAPAIHRDATAELRPHLAFEGTAYVALTPGSPSAPGLGDSAIPLSQTRVYVPLDQALRAFQPATRTALRDDVSGAAAALGGGGAAGMRRTLQSAPELMRTLGDVAGAAQGSHRAELAGAIRNLAVTTATVVQHRASVQPLLAGAEATLGAVDDQGDELDASLRELPSALAGLDSGGNAIDALVDRLRPLADELVPGLQELAPSLSEATPLLRAAAPALRRARPLVADLRGALASGARAAPATERLLRQIDPTLETLNSSLLPALHEKTPELGIPAYLAFLNLFEGGGGASRPFQTTAQGTPGHFMRFGIRFLSGFGAPLPPCSLLEQANSAIAGFARKAGVCTP